MKRSKSEVARLGEQLAADYLVKKDYRLLERNYRLPHGELDLICLHKRELVFVEVKTRSSTDQGRPEEAVNQRKQKKLASLAEAYVIEQQRENSPMRFDVVAVLMLGGANLAEITHFEHAIDFTVM